MLAHVLNCVASGVVLVGLVSPDYQDASWWVCAACASGKP
jgi:hypothetical protein